MLTRSVPIAVAMTAAFLLTWNFMGGFDEVASDSGRHSAVRRRCKRPAATGAGTTLAKSGRSWRPMAGVSARPSGVRRRRSKTVSFLHGDDAALPKDARWFLADQISDAPTKPDL